ncbi:MAG: hypothetical protein Q8O55_13070, partial [Dehalococcoidales bacterium]|nr:hypothetical protein [Dehalococcoidales bacterium]
HTMAGVWDIIVVSGKETTRAVAEEYIGKELDAWVKGPYWLVKKVVSRSSRTYISRDEAVDIASDIIPPEVTERAKITAILRPELGPSGLWQIQHRLARVTRSELGWQEDDRTRFEPDVGASLTGWEIVYPNLIITIDARTGDIVSRTATSGVLLGGGVPEIPLYPKPREQ